MPGDAVWIEHVCEKLCALILANVLDWDDAIAIAQDIELWPTHCDGRCCARDDGGCFAYESWQPFRRSSLVEQMFSDLARLGEIVPADKPPRRSRRGHLQRVFVAKSVN